MARTRKEKREAQLALAHAWILAVRELGLDKANELFDEIEREA